MAYDDPQTATPWTHRVAHGVKAFATAESSGAAALVAAVLAALVWCSIDAPGYESFWSTSASVAAGGHHLAEPLRVWVNSGLMTLFFLVVGLEARREFDLGDLRERRRFVLPCAAGLAGMAVPVLIYLLVLGGGDSAWGMVMSTDTALALGLLSVVGRRLPDRLRIFLVTVFVVDDVVALLIVTIAYTDEVSVRPLVVALVALGLVGVVRRVANRPLLVPVLLLCVTWVALLRSGVDPIVLGLVVGLATSAYAPSRDDLEQASSLFLGFREQPTPELARAANVGVIRSVSTNALLQSRLQPWTGYVVVPLFALANAGISLDPTFLRSALSHSLVWAIVAAYVVGKPIGVVGASWLVERMTGGSVRPAVGWTGVLGSGTLAGIGFTLSFIVADITLAGPRLAEAKLGVLLAALLSTAVSVVVFARTSRWTEVRRARALIGDATPLEDLCSEVDPDHDHVRGSATALVTLVEYGDLECPYCGRAESVVRELLRDTDLRYVWRHLPLTDVHPHAQLAAEASEAAGAQGRFWEMHDRLIDHQDQLEPRDLLDHARALGLDVDRFKDDLVEHRHAARVARDVESADLSTVAGTPTFFINGRRHHGSFNLESLSAAIDEARARTLLEASPPVPDAPA
ncbi:Na+/H+ antiporter NhaA [Nocardioides terrae]|uniref:Na(+)/H(+) antiporter NhaA n=1 Tax=Nocardioides terrae TaxID=574651 RepID=A0A1I1F1T2_9ACTN|nr:Na+/H+ antiporter NhaA [Nocardioides terrae]SFB93217.1 Na+/H+ antiporter NhaA [Nocardioides terrae]